VQALRLNPVVMGHVRGERTSRVRYHQSLTSGSAAHSGAPLSIRRRLCILQTVGVYNTLSLSLACPYCGAVSQMVIDTYFGYRGLLTYHAGDTVEWWPRKAVQNGGRPADGNLEGDGSTECPQCGRDFFVRVLVRADSIVGAEVDVGKKGSVLGQIPTQTVWQRSAQHAWRTLSCLPSEHIGTNTRHQEQSCG